MTTIFLVLLVLVATIPALSGCTDEPATMAHIHFELRTNDSGVRLYWVTETGDLELTLSASTQGTALAELVFGLFVDGRQWPAVWDGQPARVFRAALQPESNLEVQLRIRGLPRGIHAMHLLAAVLPTDRDLTESQMMSGGFPICMNSFTVESRSPIEAPPNQGASTNPGPAPDMLQAVSRDGVLCVDAKSLAIDPSFDVRDRQTLYYVWRNDTDNTIRAHFVLLVDWLEMPWPRRNATALAAKAEPNEVVMEEVGLAGLPIGDASCVAVIAFLEPLRPMWLLDDSGHTYADPEGGSARASNYVVVLGP